MSEQIKFTDEELKDLKNLRLTYSELSHELGQVQLNRHSLDTREKELLGRVNEVRNKEKSMADELKGKYGNGRIDIDTGVFIPSK